MQYLARYAIKSSMENDRPKDPYFYCSNGNVSGNLPTEKTETPKKEKPIVEKRNRKNPVFSGSTVHFVKELPQPK